MKRKSGFNIKALAIIAAGLIASLSWQVQAVVPPKVNAPIVMGQNMNNTGYVFVSGQGYRDAEMLFCEPSVGFFDFNSWGGPPDLEVKNGKCVSKGIGAGKTYRAVTAQQYLDELIGPGKAVPVGISPATTSVGRLIGIIYYRALKTTGAEQDEKSDGF